MTEARVPRLILAPMVLGFGALAMVGAVTGNVIALGFGGMLGWIMTTIHAVAFLARVRRRRAPAVLLGAGRGILAAILAAMAAVSIANLVLVAVFYDRAGIGHADRGSAILWAVVVIILAWRAWLVPSARRAAILQLFAVWFAVPSVFFAIVEYEQAYRTTGLYQQLTASVFIAFAILGAAGAALDKLFASVHDRGPDIVPQAIVHE